MNANKLNEQRQIVEQLIGIDFGKRIWDTHIITEHEWQSGYKNASLSRLFYNYDAYNGKKDRVILGHALLEKFFALRRPLSDYINLMDTHLAQLQESYTQTMKDCNALAEQVKQLQAQLQEQQEQTSKVDENHKLLEAQLEERANDAEKRYDEAYSSYLSYKEPYHKLKKENTLLAIELVAARKALTDLEFLSNVEKNGHGLTEEYTKRAETLLIAKYLSETGSEVESDPKVLSALTDLHETHLHETVLSGRLIKVQTVQDCDIRNALGWTPLALFKEHQKRGNFYDERIENGLLVCDVNKSAIEKAASAIAAKKLKRGARKVNAKAKQPDAEEERDEQLGSPGAEQSSEPVSI